MKGRRWRGWKVDDDRVRGRDRPRDRYPPSRPPSPSIVHGDGDSGGSGGGG